MSMQMSQAEMRTLLLRTLSMSGTSVWVEHFTCLDMKL